MNKRTFWNSLFTIACAFMVSGIGYFAFADPPSVPTSSGYITGAGVARGDIDMNHHDIDNVDELEVESALTVTGAASFGGSTTTGANSESHACAWHSTTLTFAANPGDASKTATGLIPAGSVLHAIATRVLVAGTNCATVDIGDGVDADLFGNDIAVAAGTTTNDASWTAQVMNPQLTAGDVVITGNVNCFDYSARVSAFYCTTTAPAD
jgi:hypothetical protein